MINACFFIHQKKIIKIFSLFFVQWFKINLVQKSRKSTQTMLMIISIKFCLTGFKRKESYMNHLVSPLPNRMGWRRGKTVIFLSVLEALLFQQNIPKSYWGEVVLTSAYVINRIPSKVLGCKSPLETLSQFYPNIRSSFNLAPRVFGCTSFVHIHNHNQGKLDPRALKCVFVGYSSTQKGYKCYHPHARKLYVSTNVTFDENKSYFSTPYLQRDLSTLGDEELAIPPLEIIPSSKSFKIKRNHFNVTNFFGTNSNITIRRIGKGKGRRQSNL